MDFVANEDMGTGKEHSNTRVHCTLRILVFESDLGAVLRTPQVYVTGF